MGDATRLGNLEQVELMESLGGPLSERRSGFPYVLEHDTVLRPKDCGGPLVDLDGNAVGINIARVSRVSSYALPASAIRPILADKCFRCHGPGLGEVGIHGDQTCRIV